MKQNRLEYVPENSSEVTKYGQTEAAINALVNKVGCTLFK